VARSPWGTAPWGVHSGLKSFHRSFASFPAGDRSALTPFLQASAEGVGFEPTVDPEADNGFRDRCEVAAIPHQCWSPRAGGMRGGMNLMDLRAGA
jgi:hypothetical protein